MEVLDFFTDCQWTPKKWGGETLICNTSLYCSKILTLQKNYGCSLHYHKLKDETFYVLEGSIIIHIADINLKSKICVQKLEVGGSIRIPPLTLHRFIGYQISSKILEVSTHHEDSDSYRESPAGYFGGLELLIGDVSKIEPIERECNVKN